VHKKRNVQAHVPDRHKEKLNRRLKAAYTESHYATAIALLEGTVRWLSKINHDAAASMSEGLEETLTVTRLGLGKTLHRTFATTNAIESALSMARRMTNRVTKWRDGDMRHRWCTAALRDGGKRFKRVKGYRELGKLVEALTNRHRPFNYRRDVLGRSGCRIRRRVGAGGRFGPFWFMPPQMPANRFAVDSEALCDLPLGPAQRA